MCLARINVEDGLWSDPRFMKLCIKTGDQFRAIGLVVLAWKLAHKFWCPSKLPIPEKDFLDAGLDSALIDCGLAEHTPNGVRMKGSEKHFSWWFEKQKAGKRSAQARKKKYGSAQPNSNTAEQVLNTSSDFSRTSSSYSSSYSKEKKMMGKSGENGGENTSTSPPNSFSNPLVLTEKQVQALKNHFGKEFFDSNIGVILCEINSTPTTNFDNRPLITRVRQMLEAKKKREQKTAKERGTAFLKSPPGGVNV